MQKKLEAVVELLRRTSGATMTLSLILAVLADLLIRALIPGAGIVESILSILSSLLILISMLRKNQQPFDPRKVHDAFATITPA